MARQLDMMGVLIDIEVCDTHDNLGTFSLGDGKIRVSNTVSDSQKAEVLLHEIIHATIKHMGLLGGEFDEERFVCGLSAGLFCVLSANPEVLKLIWGRGGGGGVLWPQPE